MTSFNIQFDPGLAKFSNLAKSFQKQLPFAQVGALNDIGFKVMNDVKTSVLPSHLRLRNQFTKNAFQADKASKSNIKLEVGFISKAWYMESLNDKKGRTAKKKYIPVPTLFARRGNMLKGLVKAPMKMDKIDLAIGASKYFKLKMKTGHWGIFKRVSKEVIKLCYTLVEHTTYNKNEYFDFKKVIYSQVEKHHFETILMTRLLRAVK